MSILDVNSACYRSQVSLILTYVLYVNQCGAGNIKTTKELCKITKHTLMTSQGFVHIGASDDKIANESHF